MKWMALLLFPVLPAAPQQPLQVPHGPVTELPSPGGRFVLFGLPYQPGARQGPELWIRDRRTGERRRLLALSSTAEAAWSPGGSAFFVADRIASSTTPSYIYERGGRTRLDVEALLRKTDPKLEPFSQGHFYVQAVRWQDSRTILVACFGHTDEPPVRCFRFRYLVSRDGKVRKLSQRVEPASSEACRTGTLESAGSPRAGAQRAVP